LTGDQREAGIAQYNPPVPNIHAAIRPRGKNKSYRTEACIRAMAGINATTAGLAEFSSGFWTCSGPGATPFFKLTGA
jgi:hypothetical protein